MDPTQMRRYLAPDCCFRFGNQPEVRDRHAFEQMSTQFYSMLSSISHQIEKSWISNDEHVITRVIVTYRRLDGFELTCPAAGIWRLTNGLISEYDVYVDNSRLFV